MAEALIFSEDSHAARSRGRIVLAILRESLLLGIAGGGLGFLLSRHWVYRR